MSREFDVEAHLTEVRERVEARVERIEAVVGQTREELVAFRATTAAALDAIKQTGERVESKVNGNEQRIGSVETAVVSLRTYANHRTRIKVAWIGAAGAIGMVLGAAIVKLIIG
ncbi:MAG: hypothetical protein ACYTG0_12645 [Planctomycetota bacterium]|jgi:hypothetical protein